jgi:hypothetical protein
MNETINISGSIGFILLKKSNDYFMIFFDNHEDENYCDIPITSNNSSLKKDAKFFIHNLIDLFLKKKKQLSIFIEEPLTYINIKLIWSSKHLQKFQKYISTYKNNINNLYLTDIRTNILPIDYTLIHSNINYSKIKLTDYLKNIIKFEMSFFDFLGKYKIEKNIIFNNYYININNKINKLKELININDNILPFFNNDDNITLIDDILNDMMNLYTYHIIEKYKNNVNILYFGLYHSIEIIYYLTKSDNYKVLFEYGISLNRILNNKLILNDFDKLPSCTKINSNIINSLLKN